MPKAVRRTDHAQPVQDTAPYPSSKPTEATKGQAGAMHYPTTAPPPPPPQQQQQQRAPLTTLANVPAPAPQQHGHATNAAETQPASFLAISLGGEENRGLPVYDSCEELREKIRVFLEAKPLVPGQTDRRGNPKTYTRTQLVKDLGVNTNTLRRFMDREGEMAGAELGAYYSAYCFFEKLRIFNGEEKSTARLAAEKMYPEGRPLKDPTHRKPVWVFVKQGENPNDFLTDEEVAKGWYFPDFPTWGERLATGELTLADIDRMEAERKKNGLAFKKEPKMEEEQVTKKEEVEA